LRIIAAQNARRIFDRVVPEYLSMLNPRVRSAFVIPGLRPPNRNAKLLRQENASARRPIGKFLMASSNDHDPLEAGNANLSGVRILVVEDSWHIGMALKSLLRSFGMDVAGPVATSADAERLIAEQVPDAAIVDYNLRGGELAHGLIDRLNELGVRVILVTGYAAVPVPPEKAAVILQKPIMEAQLLAALHEAAEHKAGR
jgi:CheY-like chemotaxis protein